MRLPKSAQELADVIGRDKALYLIGQLPRHVRRDKRYPGATVEHVMMYVPTERRLKPDHHLVRVLGWNDAMKLCRHFGGEILQPGNCRDVYRQFRDASIVRMIAEGMPVKLIAEWMQVTDRHVRGLIAEIPHKEVRAANDNNATTLTAAYAQGHL